MSRELKPAWLLAGLTGLVLLALSGRYGYHRDELYFLQAGHHPAFGYPDQPPLTPLLARLMSAIAPHSLVVLRLPSTLSAAAVVVVAGAMSRDLGARRDGVWFASGCVAISGFVLALGHLLSTATTAFLGSTVVTYLLLQILLGRAGRRRWLLLGLVTGVTLQANVFPAFLLAAALVAIVAFGPRSLLRTPEPWLAALLAAVVVSPYLVWQARHGWPQLDVAHHIAAGGSGSSVSRPLFLPFLVLQNGPWLLPVWGWGLVRLLRDPRLRALGAAFPIQAVVFLVLGGKPYYLAGLLPLLLAAGAQPLLDAVRRRRRRWVPVALLVLSSPVLVFTLPVLPTSAAGIAIAVDPDAGETIGWPSFTRQVAAAYHSLAPGAAIVTDNYGQAGAIDRYGGGLGLPPAYSGHNGFGLWGHPPGQVTVLAVGVDPALLRSSCTHVREVGMIRTVDGLDNDENGTVLDACTPMRPWSALWSTFRHLD